MEKQNTGKPFLVLAIIIAIIVRLIPVAVISSFFWFNETTESHEEEVLNGLPDYTHGDKWIYGIFQDFTVYGEYKYNDEIKKFLLSEKNTNFKHVDSDAEDEIRKVVSSFEDCVYQTKDTDKSVGDDLYKVYTFSRTMIDDSDWYYFQDYEEDEYDYVIEYTLYYFDSQTKTIYLMHNNI
ncbi:MAG: hypothetical protein MJ168_09865 [Clostridia bacterium]|nr:hypothetical protein [Clostridia bacterium]